MGYANRDNMYNLSYDNIEKIAKRIEELNEKLRNVELGEGGWEQLEAIQSEISRLESEIESRGNSFTELNSTVQNHSTQLESVTAQLAQKATKEEVSNALDGSPKGTYTTLADLQNAYPNGTTGVYIVQADGHIYSWDGSMWADRGQYQSTGISDESITLDKLNNSSLMLDYVRGENQTGLPIMQGGAYEISLNEKGKVYLSNGNIVDLLNFTDGTQTLNGVTVTVKGNHVSIVGEATANTFAKLSDGFQLQTSNVGLNSRTYEIPNIPNYSLVLSNRTYNEGLPGLTVNIRSTVSGNVRSKIVTDTSPSVTVPYNNEWGAFYMFIPVGVYQAEFDICLMPIEYNNEFEVPPATSIIENVKKTRLSLNKGAILSDVTGTATELVNIFEGLQPQKPKFPTGKLYVESHSTYFHFYIKGSKEDSNKYLRYTFEYYENTYSKAKGWVLGLVDAVELVDGSFNYLYPVVVAGEWEMALRITDRPDFIGCKQHGSEINFYEKFYVDGKPWIPDNSSFWCDEIKIIQKSDMYDPLDDATPIENAIPIGRHIREHIINKDGIRIPQRVEWLADFTMDMSYVTMLPIARGNDTVTPDLISGVAYDNYRLEEIDISVIGHDAKTYVHEPTKWNLYSISTGITAEVQSNIKNKPDSSLSFIQNTDKYNKVYFAYCDNGFTVVNGDIWEWESIFKLDISA